MEKPAPSSIPAAPGIYLYKDERSRILYVGKAKNLRKRVLSYFREQRDFSGKTRAMLAKAASVETLSTATEKEALLLEASLIKKHRPRYNILLRDDKDYALFRLAVEKPFPRLEMVRRARPGQEKGGALLFGPFSSAVAARETWKAIHQVFPLRRCSDKAFANRARPCLYHHMGLCLGPCSLPVDKAAYEELIRQVALFLEGRSGELLQTLRSSMRAASDALNFERAAVLRDRISAVERTLERQSVILASDEDMDVMGLSSVSGGLALGMLFVRRGVLLDKRALFWPGLDLDDGPELLQSVLVQFYQAGAPVPQRVIAPWLSKRALRVFGEDGSSVAIQDSLEEAAESFSVLATVLSELRGSRVRLSGPRNSEENTLVTLAAANAREAARHDKPDLSALLGSWFGLNRPVERIEAVDVSHTGGTVVRVGMVVFEAGQPLKSAYRSYSVESGGDDYAALASWAERRAAAGPPWPDLVLVDGGRGQVHAVERSFAGSGVSGFFALAGIAKSRDEKGRTNRSAGAVDRIFVPGRSNPLALKRGSPELFLLQYIRDAAHDFVLNRHRRARKRQALAGELLRIPGVGAKTARLLWERFDSLASMAAAGEEEFAGIPGIGPKLVQAIRGHLSALRDAGSPKTKGL
jgi:excinuclease ABC subunit C